MSDYERNQRGYTNSDWRERYTNRFRDEGTGDEWDSSQQHPSENYGRFERGHHESHLSRRPSNQWGNYGTQESSHDRSGTGSYFGSRGYPYGNFEARNRDDRYNYYRNRPYSQRPENRQELDFNRSYDHQYEPYRGYNQYDYEDEMTRSSWPQSRDENGNRSNAWRSHDRQFGEQGQHRGKGPKGYNRSDDRIREDVNDRLSDNPYVDASEIEVQVMNGEVTLTGTVDERNSKRMAEDIAESVLGVKNVENRIRVVRNDDNTWTVGPESKTENKGKTTRSRQNGFVEAEK